VGRPKWVTVQIANSQQPKKMIQKNKQYYKFCFYGFLKNLRFFDAFFLLYLLQKGFTYTEIGGLYAIRELVINFAEIPTGIIADTYGRKNALVISFLAYIISFLLFAFSTNYIFTLLAFVLYGLGDSFRSGTHKAMIMHYLALQNKENTKINYYGHTRACSQRGSALSALIAGAIVYFSGNYQSIFIISTLPYLLNMLLIISYPNELNSSVKKKNRKSIWKTIKNLFYTISKPRVFAVVHSSAVFTAFQKSVKDYIQPLMIKVALIIPFLIDEPSEKRNGLIVGILYFLLFLLNARASTLAEKISKKLRNPVILSLLVGFIFGIISAVFYQLNWWFVSLLFFTGIYLIESIRKPILTGLLSERVPNEILASAISAQSLYRSLLTAVLSLGFGYSIDHFGLGYGLIIMSTLLLLSVIIVIISHQLTKD
jgi:MFS family permease